MTEDSKNKIPKRCNKEGCRCKLKLTDFPCRCGKYFCSEHKLSEYHGCTFDYKAMNKEFLLKTLSTPIVAEKLTMI